MQKEITQEQWAKVQPMSAHLPLTVESPKNRYSEFNHIELTEDEIEDALGYRRMLKARDIEDNQKKQERADKIKKWREPWTYEQLKSAVMNRAKQLPFEFEIDKDNEKVIHLLCLYYSGDERFNSETWTYSNGQVMNLSLKKGIGLISSKKGTGKSILTNLFQQNKYRPFLKIETKNVAAMYQKDGDKAIDIHSELIHIAPNPDFYFYQDIGICFDDLGFELPKNNWGSKSDVMADVLFAIYRKNQLIGDYSWFYFTSNLSGKDFEERYDDRIRDRMREMFNVITIHGESRRK